MNNRNGKAMSIVGGLSLAGGISLGMTLLISLIIAKMLETEKITWDTVGYYVMAMLMGTSFVSAFTAVRKIKRRKLQVSLMAGAVYYSILLAVTALFFGGQYEAVGVTLLLVLAGSMCAALTGERKKGRKGRIKHPVHR